MEREPLFLAQRALRLSDAYDIDTQASTCFVPTNHAILKYASQDPEAHAYLDSEGGASAVQAHIIPAQMMRVADFPQGVSAYTTKAGTRLTVAKAGDTMTVANESQGNTALAHVILSESDLLFGGCVVHAIDAVLAPVASSPKAMARSAPSVDAAVAADLSWAAESLARMGLDPGQSKCTIFCPSNDAIAKYAAQQPRAVLSLATESGARSLDAHILPNVQMQLNDFPSGTSTFTTKAGTSMTVIRMNTGVTVIHGAVSADIISSDIVYGHSIIHVCDHILEPIIPLAPQPFGPLETKAEEEAMAVGAASPHVADVGWSIKALQQAGITALLNNATAFMPSDTAIFHHAREQGVSSADPRLVRSHIIPSHSLQLSEISEEGFSSYDTLEPGAFLTIARKGVHCTVSLNSGPMATVITANFPFGDGSTAHVIDRCLTPGGVAAPQSAPVPPTAFALPQHPLPVSSPASPSPSRSSLRSASAADLIPPPVGPSPMEISISSKMQSLGMRATYSASAIASDCTWAQDALTQAGPSVLQSGNCIFVPTDEALKRYSASNPLATSAATLGSPSAFAHAVSGHMIKGLPMLLSDLAEGDTPYTSACSQPLVVTKRGSFVQVSSPTAVARIVVPDVQWAGNVLHTIDAVLEPLGAPQEEAPSTIPRPPGPIPAPLLCPDSPSGSALTPRVATTEDLTYATETLRRAGMDLFTGTIFAPSNAAIARYAAAEPMAASMITSDAGESAIKAHVIPDVVLTLESFPEGVTVYASLTGDRITVTKSGPLLSVSTGSLPGEIIGGNILHGPNAIVHIVDLCLSPVQPLPHPLAPSSPAAYEEGHSIFLAMKAAQLAGLDAEFLSQGQGTFFLPDDSALSAHSKQVGGEKAAFNQLTKPQGRAALRAHFIAGKSLPPSSIPEGTSVHASALGTPLIITKLAGSLAAAATFDGITRAAKVVRTIISGSCVLHLVDKVLAPLI